MTDRHSGYIITLAENIREDDAEATITALRQIKGVIAVEPILGNVDVAIAQMNAEARVKLELLRTFNEFWDGLFKREPRS